SPLAFVAEEVAVLGQGVLHDLGKFDDSWHEQMLHTPFAPGKKMVKTRSISLIFTPSAVSLQRTSYSKKGRDLVSFRDPMTVSE
ncbi:MAG: hypothetical protein ACLP7Q_10850, partial [Isosphaeraceae bacterium]